MSGVGRALIVLGLVLVLTGVALTLVPRVPWIGRLPGDVHVQRGNWSFYFPLTTSLIVSVVLSLLFYLLGRR